MSATTSRIWKVVPPVVTAASTADAPRGATPPCGAAVVSSPPHAASAAARTTVASTAASAAVSLAASRACRSSSQSRAVSVNAWCLDGLERRYHTIRVTTAAGVFGSCRRPVLHDQKGRPVKVLAVLIIVLGLVIIIVPQFTNCEYGKEHPETLNMQTSDAAVVEYASMGEMDARRRGESTSVPYRMMKCFWSARAEIMTGVPLIALGILLLFARRKETFRVIGIMTARHRGAHHPHPDLVRSARARIRRWCATRR